MTPPVLPFLAAHRVGVTVEGVTDLARSHAIAESVRDLFRHESGKWLATIRPCDGRGRWRLELRGGSGRHIWSFAAALSDLPGVVARKLRAFLHSDGVACGPTASPRNQAALALPFQNRS